MQNLADPAVCVGLESGFSSKALWCLGISGGAVYVFRGGVSSVRALAQKCPAVMLRFRALWGLGQAVCVVQYFLGYVDHAAVTVVSGTSWVMSELLAS